MLELDPTTTYGDPTSDPFNQAGAGDPAAELERSRAALDVAGFGVVWVDSDGALLQLNAAATRLLATGAVDARQRGVTWDTFRPVFADGTPATVAALSVGDAVQRREVELVDTTGARQTVVLESHPPIERRHTGRAEQLLLLRSPAEAVADRAPAPAGTTPFARLRSVPAAISDVDEAADVLIGADLTPREREIVELLLHGYRVASIAPRLYLSTHTIRNHLKSVFRKAGVASQAELIELVRQRRAG